MPQPAPRRAEREAVLRLIFELPPGDQLHVFIVLREYLGQELEPEGELDSQIRRRQETLEALQDAAGELELPSDQAPTTVQYRDTVAAARVSVSQIVRAWGSWRQAQAAMTGGWVQPSPAQRSLRRAASGRRGTRHDYLSSVREWLATNPRTDSYGEYSDWAKARNQRRTEGQRPLPTGSAVLSGLKLSWRDVLEVARGDSTLTAKQQERADQLLGQDREDTDLIGSAAITLLTGHQHQHLERVMRADPRFPVPVAKVTSVDAWAVGDVRAYLAGQHLPRRASYEWQDRVLGIHELGDRLGVKRATIVRRLVSGTTRLCPPPSGRVGRIYYWWRAAVDDWFAAGNPQYRTRHP